MMRAPRSGEDLIITHTQSLDCQDTVDLLVCRHWFLQGKLLRGGAWAGPLEPPALGMPVVQVYQAIVDPYRSVGEVVEENVPCGPWWQGKALMKLTSYFSLRGQLVPPQAK